MPDVDVLMAVYNGMPHLPAAVDSVFRQTLESWTLVIVNDGSTDGSRAYLDGLDDPRVTVIHTKNSGLGAALNRGLADCRSEFVARMDADDISHPERLERQTLFLRRRPEVGLVGTQIERSGDARGAGRSLLPLHHEDIDRHLMSGLPALYHPTIMCRTRLLRQVGGYWELRFGEESDLFLRVAEVAELANLDQVLLSYRFDTGSMTGANMAAMRSHVEYAIECARRRRSGLPAIPYDLFEASRRAESWWNRIGRAMDIYARGQYRLAMGDVLGSRRLFGYARLMWAAACSPKLTGQRIARVIRDRRGRSSGNSASRRPVDDSA